MSKYDDLKQRIRTLEGKVYKHLECHHPLCNCAPCPIHQGKTHRHEGPMDLADWPETMRMEGILDELKGNPPDDDLDQYGSMEAHYPGNMHKPEKMADDLPLRAKVAKCLGHEVYHYSQDLWAIRTNEETDKFVKNYDSDLTAAMAALEEYMQGGKYSYQINSVGPGTRYLIDINEFDEGWHDDREDFFDDLPTAICEAIVAHHEGEGKC